MVTLKSYIIMTKIEYLKIRAVNFGKIPCPCILGVALAWLSNQLLRDRILRHGIFILESNLIPWLLIYVLDAGYTYSYTSLI